MQSIRRAFAIVSAGLLTAILATTHACGPQSGNNTSADDVEMTVAAFGGEPFGVGIVTVTGKSGQKSPLSEPDPVALEMLGPNAFYPVTERTGLVTRESDKSDELRVHFLFDPQRANEILVLGRSIKLEPKKDKAAHGEALVRAGLL